MDPIVAKLLDIENTAEAIVDHAESQKPIIEREIQEKRAKFDAELEAETQKKLDTIRQERQEEIDRVLAEQREITQSLMTRLQQEYEQNHTAYAKQIIAQITEV